MYGEAHSNVATNIRKEGRTGKRAALRGGRTADRRALRGAPRDAPLGAPSRRVSRADRPCPQGPIASAAMPRCRQQSLQHDTEQGWRKGTGAPPRSPARGGARTASREQRHTAAVAERCSPFAPPPLLGFQARPSPVLSIRFSTVYTSFYRRGCHSYKRDRHQRSRSETNSLRENRP